MSFKFTNKLVLLFILTLTGVITIDSNYINFFSYTNKELSTPLKILFFVTFSILFSVFAAILLKNIKSYYMKSNQTQLKHKNLVQYIALASQFLVISFLAVEIFQMGFLNMYNSNLTLLALFASFVPSILFMVLLVLLLIGWFGSSKSFMIMAYAISFSIICIYLIVSSIYIYNQFTYTSEWIKPRSLHSTLVNTFLSYLSTSFGAALDMLSLLSFVLVWIATVTLLRQYRIRIGRNKYWITIIIPLIYFLFPFERYISDFTEQWLSESPVIFTIIYIFLFSATKQVGGLLFSIVFLTASTKIKQTTLQNSLKITAIGVAIVFSCLEINSILYATYPPYGIVSIMLMPLGSYSLFIGLLMSARLISQDKKLRLELFQSSENQLAFLKTIGKVQMEKEIEKNLKSILKRGLIIEVSKDDYEDQENVSELVQEVIKELRFKTSEINKSEK